MTGLVCVGVAAAIFTHWHRKWGHAFRGQPPK